jgi:hypothetical protein
MWLNKVISSIFTLLHRGVASLQLSSGLGTVGGEKPRHGNG